MDDHLVAGWEEQFMLMQQRHKLQKDTQLEVWSLNGDTNGIQREVDLPCGDLLLANQ